MPRPFPRPRGLRCAFLEDSAQAGSQRLVRPTREPTVATSCPLAEEMTLYDVLETVEGPYAFSRCIAPDFECTRKSSDCIPCKFQKIYCDISKTVQAQLRAVHFFRPDRQINGLCREAAWWKKRRLLWTGKTTEPSPCCLGRGSVYPLPGGEVLPGTDVLPRIHILTVEAELNVEVRPR